MHVQDIFVDRDGELRYHARPRVSLMRCGLTPLCSPTCLSLSLSWLPLLLPILPSTHYPNYTLLMTQINERPRNNLLL